MMHFKPSFTQQIIMRSLNGIGSAIIFIVAMPEFMHIISEIYPLFSEELIGDVSSALYNSSWRAGETIGPILGGWLTEKIGFV